MCCILVQPAKSLLWQAQGSPFHVWQPLEVEPNVAPRQDGGHGNVDGVPELSEGRCSLSQSVVALKLW